MLPGIITIIAALVPFVIALIRGRMAKNSDPQNELLKANQESDKAIASGDATAVTLQLNDIITRLQNRSGNTKQ